MTYVFVIILVASATLFSTSHGDDNLKAGVPDAKLISTFQIVRFPNDACTGSSATRNGTCYTSAECSDKGGTSQGSCADGFGVCCIFVITACGQSSSENSTYWDAPATIPTGECALTINPLNDNICQLRLDFLTFVITGPSTNSLSEIAQGPGAFPGGTISTIFIAYTTSTANQAAWTTNCFTDTFSVSSPNPSTKPPVLCGVNNGYHMYVDMDADTSNVLSFLFQRNPGPASALQDTRGVTSIAARDWDITINQYECGYVNRAPPGCTQWIWSDEGTQIGGWIESYNFQGAAGGSKHLANQNQKICIRRERTICWAAIYFHANGLFEVSGTQDGDATPAAVAGRQTAAGMPCGYGCGNTNSLGAETIACSGYDCVIIPGLFGVSDRSAVANVGTNSATVAAATAAQVRLGIVAATTHAPAGPQVSGGGGFGTSTNLNGVVVLAGADNSQTLFTQHVPFQVTFKSDGFEGRGIDGEFPLLTNSAGFKLAYDLVPCAA